MAPHLAYWWGCKRKNTQTKAQIKPLDLLMEPRFVDEDWRAEYHFDASKNQNHSLNCHVEGVPFVTVTWYKYGVQLIRENDKLIDTQSKRVYEYHKHFDILYLNNIDVVDEATYTCK